jgi:hypothetical protein
VWGDGNRGRWFPLPKSAAKPAATVHHGGTRSSYLLTGSSGSTGRRRRSRFGIPQPSNEDQLDAIVDDQ